MGRAGRNGPAGYLRRGDVFFFIKYIGFENSFSNESDTIQIYLSTQTFKLEEIQITHLNTSLGSVVRRQTG